MSIFEDLTQELKIVESESCHEGYWYSISDTLTILISGSLCGLTTIMEIHEWASSNPAKEFFERNFGIKRILSKSQFYNILAVVNAEAFKKSFIRWMQNILKSALPGKTIAIDGKTICSTDKLTKDGSVLHIVSAYVSELKLTIGSNECNCKPHERAAFRELLTMLNLTNTIIVADALHCNKPTIKAILEADADYLLVVKDNASALKNGVQACLDASPAATFITKEKNGGRIETRTAYTTTNLELLDCSNDWQGIQCVGAIHRSFEKNGVTSNQWHLYISSKPLTPEQLLHHARMEWGVESMHWLLDVHFSEDKTRLFDMNVQNILNIVRKICLNLVQTYKASNHKPAMPASRIMRANLFDTSVLEDFLVFFKQ